MTTTDTDAAVWVEEYVTSTGVHVEGHWRAKPTRHADAGDGPTADPHIPTASSAAEAPPAQSYSTAATTRLTRDVATPVDVDTTRRQLKDVQIQLGLLALQPSSDDATLRRRELLEQRGALKSQLNILQSEPATATTPPESLDDPARGAGPATQCPSCGQFRGPSHTCPPPTGLPDSSYGDVPRGDRHKAMLADLETSIQAIVDSGQLTRWLDAMASNGMARWSLNNRLLAAVQMVQRGADITDLHLMGFRQWDQKHNRTVRRGEKAVWILAPMTRKVTEEDDAGKTTERSRVVGFKAVPVFDISQTEGDPLPAPPTKPAPGEATPGTLQGLRDRVGQAGYTYLEEEIPDCRPATGEGTLGYTDPATKRIVVDQRLDSAQKASTIAHELGHVHCGHVDSAPGEYQRHRGQMESEAEMTAYLVNRARGMSRDGADSFSPGYIAGWSRGDTTVVRGAMDKATKAFNKIMDGDWPSH